MPHASSATAFFGDATRLDLLRTAGAAQAHVIVVAVDSVQGFLEIVDLARAHFRRRRSWRVPAT